MGNLVFGSAERPGNLTDAAEIPVVRDNDVAIGQGARPTERPEKATAAARHRCSTDYTCCKTPIPNIVVLLSVTCFKCGRSKQWLTCQDCKL